MRPTGHQRHSSWSGPPPLTPHLELIGADGGATPGLPQKRSCDYGDRSEDTQTPNPLLFSSPLFSIVTGTRRRPALASDPGDPSGSPGSDTGADGSLSSDSKLPMCNSLLSHSRTMTMSPPEQLASPSTPNRSTANDILQYLENLEVQRSELESEVSAIDTASIFYPYVQELNATTLPRPSRWRSPT